MGNREKLILEKIADEEYIARMQLKGARQIVYETLIEKKGFHPEEIEIDPNFILELNTSTVKVSTDFMIHLGGICFMVIRCVPSGIESWQRSVIAFARVIKDYQIPYAVITDGDQAKEIDILKNVSIQKSVHELMNRQEALRLRNIFQAVPYPNSKIEKEKRIIYAFEDIKCSPGRRISP